MSCADILKTLLVCGVGDVVTLLLISRQWMLRVILERPSIFFIKIASWIFKKVLL